MRAAAARLGDISVTFAIQIFEATIAAVVAAFGDIAGLVAVPSPNVTFSYKTHTTTSYGILVGNIRKRAALGTRICVGIVRITALVVLVVVIIIRSARVRNRAWSDLRE
jgi:hypothetical protein